jgi:hypothetical protein
MSINFIAVLDHQHLENTIFLTSFAKSLSNLGDRKGIIIHGDSPYTDRLIQTGIMREDAQIRATKDLNKRLIGLFADQGIPTIGIHGFQKEIVSIQNDEIVINKKKIKSLHHVPNLLLSCLADANGSQRYISLPRFSVALSNAYQDAEILLFSMNEKDEILIKDEQEILEWDAISEQIENETLPGEFKSFGKRVKITTATDFANWPNLKKCTVIQ